MKNLIRFLCFSLFILSGCKENTTTTTSESSGPLEVSPIQLQSLPADQTAIDFVNQVDDKGKVNIFTWHFIYNGAGVAAGDINNDGLVDLYFTGSMVPDKLYLNKGDFKFEDITMKAGISTKIWSSGVTMADVNSDGLLDIYVCKNSPTANTELNRNLLYINMGDNVFREQAAQYGIADVGFGVQSTFFDADQDGDLDMFLVNQPFDEFAKLVNPPAAVAAYPKTDRFFFFENGKFVDKTTALGMTDERYGLNVSIGDFDLNGWTDLYICNDYHHGDRYYLNFEGRFKESMPTHAGHTSFYSMGSDVADVNQDGWLDLLSLDMAFEDHYRSKTNMGSMQAERFWTLVEEGNHYQYMQNVLQMNMGYGYFSDQAQIAGVHKSDWSYSALFADLDLDSDQDLLITNGILRDLRNNDFQVFVKEKYQNQVGPDNYLEVLNNLPSTPIPNVLYSNDGNSHFTKAPPEAAFDKGSFSHGMAVADLDNDGRLDVIINNMNAPASIYKNTTETNGHYLTVKLQGPGTNKNGLGCSVIVYSGDKKQINTMQTTRGYFSASEPAIHFGLGSHTQVDSMKIIWDHKFMTVLKNVETDKVMTISFAKEKKIPFNLGKMPGVQVSDANIVSHEHWEDAFNDYKLQVLLPYKLSQNGPFIAVADVNGDQREDFYIGGAAGRAGTMYTQSSDGKFSKTNQPAFEKDKSVEDQEAVFLDADKDGDQDLIVTSGSNEFSEGNTLLRPRYYTNDGKGNYISAQEKIPTTLINGQCVEAFDADLDGDIDLFIGGRLVGGKYPLPASSYLWINENGIFSDKTKELAPFLHKIGLITDAVTHDMEGDGDMDILIVGEWMKPTWIINGGKSAWTTSTIDAAGTGLWWTIEKSDTDGDGDMDFLLGNLGWNNKFGGSQGTKLEVFANDFDRNGDFDVVLASMKQDKLLPVRGRECSSQEMPFILDKFPDYESYASAELNQILTDDQLKNSEHKKLSTMSSIQIINEGNGNYKLQELPAMCQAGPVKAFFIDDYNHDGKQDFMYAGNHFPTEVETARYDGLYPGICFGDGNGAYRCEHLYIGREMRIDDIRDIQKIKSADGSFTYLLSNNNGTLRAYNINGMAKRDLQ